MQAPRISIVIATHNRAHWLEQAMNSVIAQTYRPLELVVVDDGSTDDTADSVAALQARWRHQPGLSMRYLKQDNSGPAVARNRGISLSRGDYLSFMDDDDLLAPDAVARLVQALKSHRDAAVVGHASYASTDAEGRPTQPRQRMRPPRCRAELLARMIRDSWFVPIHGNLFSRCALERIGPWNSQLTSQEDDEFMLRAILQDVSFVAAPRAMVYYRQHQEVRRSRPGAPESWDERGQTQRLYADLATRELAFHTLRERGQLIPYRTAFAGWHRRLEARYRPLLNKLEAHDSPQLQWIEQGFPALGNDEPAQTTPSRADNSAPESHGIGMVFPWPRQQSAIA